MSEKQSSTPRVTAPITVPAQSVKPSKPAEESKEKKSRPNQKTQSHVTGNDNVGGNNISGDNNVTGNNNQTGVAIAPNGIAITGGTVNNPTVNNVSALPDLTMSDEQEKQVSDSIGDLFAGADVTVTAVQPDQSTRDVSDRLTRVLKSKGANVEYDTVQMYVPAAGMLLHKGLSITSFPTERKAAVDTLVKALGDAGVVKVVPIYDRRDRKIGVVVNRSSDTREEAKQY
jgi:hypothetical protein